jgi:hypothetical protein
LAAIESPGQDVFAEDENGEETGHRIESDGVYHQRNTSATADDDIAGPSASRLPPLIWTG